jgi:hypothetical protein
MSLRRIAYLLAAVLLLVPVAASAGAFAGNGPPSPASCWSALVEQVRSFLPGAAGGLAPPDRRQANAVRQPATAIRQPAAASRRTAGPGPARRVRPPMTPACDNTGTADPNGCPHL